MTATHAQIPKVLSLGGGLDSFAMLVSAIERGELPDVVVFIDVGHPDDPGEWASTYRHIREIVVPLCELHGIRFVWIDSTTYSVRDARSLFAWLHARNQIPVAGPNRICTRVAKVERFEAWLDDAYPDQAVQVWIGFEAGEEARVAKDPNAGKPRKHKPGQAVRINRFPLIEEGLCRCQCVELVRRKGFPIPRKSACVFCPYASRGDWQTLQREEPATFDRIVDLEQRKPLTKKNGRKLSIMAYDSRTQTGTPLPVYVSRPYKPRPKPCKVCGAAQRATKATGCDYLEDA